MSSKLNSSFLVPLQKLSRLLAKTHTQGMLIGGVAAGLLGNPRFTADIDAVILLDFERIEEFIKAAATLGFVPRIKDAARFARKSHVILLAHKKSGIDIDLSIGMLPFEREAIDRSKKFSSDDVAIGIPSPEDLIIMKAVAHRPKDIEDVRAIIENNPSMDVARIRRWIKEFAEVLEMPELWDDVEKMFRRKR